LALVDDGLALEAEEHMPMRNREPPTITINGAQDLRDSESAGVLELKLE